MTPRRPESIDAWIETYGRLRENLVFPDEWNRRDQFSQGDYQVAQSVDTKWGRRAQRVNSRTATEQREIPLWMNNERAVVDLVRIAFPKIATCEHSLHWPKKGCDGCRDNQNAALWNFIVARFRANTSSETIAREWHEEMTGEDVAEAADFRNENDEAGQWLRENGAQVKSKDNSDRALTAAKVRRTVQEMRFLTQGLTRNGTPRTNKRGRPKKELEVKAVLVTCCKDDD